MSGRLLVIGDVHGCAAELETLLARIPWGPGDTLVCVGDYIDRGPASATVLDLLIAQQGRTDAQLVCLRGNHEDMCLGFLDRGGHWGGAWRDNGARATLRSWGLPPECDAAMARATIPPAHLRFLDGLSLWHRTKEHLVVHAGIDPQRGFDPADEDSLLWIREGFFDRPHGLRETIVFGHTAFRAVLVDLPSKIGIDTGCVYGGKLTCLDATEGWLHQVQRGSRRVEQRPLARRVHPA